MDWGINFTFLLINSNLLYALLTIVMMCRLFEISISRRIATGTVFIVCILQELSMGNVDLVMCITSHLEGSKACYNR